MKSLDQQVLQALLEASEKMMEIVTGEDEKEWQRSQAYEEAPYHFLWAAIRDAKNFMRE